MQAKRQKKYGLFLMAILFSHSIFALNFFVDHTRGWHWYEIYKEKKYENLDPVAQMDAIKSKIQFALSLALVCPTKENVRNYIELQNKVSLNSSIFASLWQKVLIDNPELNYSLIHPTNNIAAQTESDIENKKEEMAIAKFAKEYGFIFFYKGSCSYCRKFAPIIKEFAISYRIAIIPVTIDGVVLSEFPYSKIDKGESQILQAKFAPALFIAKPNTNEIYPLSYGFISTSDLRKRILALYEGIYDAK